MSVQQNNKKQNKTFTFSCYQNGHNLGGERVNDKHGIPPPPPPPPPPHKKKKKKKKKKTQ